MGILSDRQIREEVGITPFEENQISKGVISYGLSSYGYDMRLGYDFKLFTPTNSTTIDPKSFDEKSFVDVKKTAENNVLIIPPNSFALGYSYERIKIPRDVLAICLGKSTYARCGLIVNVTPLEPEWEGHVTIEMSNTAPLPAKIYAGEGIMQVLFLRSDESGDLFTESIRILGGLSEKLKDFETLAMGFQSASCEKSYADKKGKYQDQKAQVTLPKVMGK